MHFIARHASIRQNRCVIVELREYIAHWRRGGKDVKMDKKTAEHHDEKLREQMIAFIIKTIRQLDMRKLRNVYNFIQGIK